MSDPFSGRDSNNQTAPSSDLFARFEWNPGQPGQSVVRRNSIGFRNDARSDRALLHRALRQLPPGRVLRRCAMSVGGRIMPSRITMRELALIAVLSPIVFTSPPIACRNRAENGGAAIFSLPCEKRFTPFLSTRLMWTCIPEPESSSKGLAMKQATKPCCRATALMARWPSNWRSTLSKMAD